MLYNNNTETEITDNKSLFSNIKKNQKVRKWQEIAALKSRRKLLKELQEIDPTFSFSANDLI